MEEFEESSVKNSTQKMTRQSPIAKFTKQYSKLLVFVLAFALIGTATLLYTHAASTSATGPITAFGAKWCLDDKYSQFVNGNPVWLYTCNSTNAQQWTLPGDGTIRLDSNKYCLDVANSSTAAKTTVDLYTCNGTPSQQWTVKTGGSGSTITNTRSSFCLDDQYRGQKNGNVVWIYTCNGTPAQQWSAPKPSTTPTPTPVCPNGETGTPPNCIQPTPTPTCPTGDTGTPPNCVAPTPTPTPSPTPTGTYTVVGNTIQNSSGQTVIVHGVNRPSLEWDCTGDPVTGGSGGIPASDFTTMRSKWNANAVRIPLDQDFWLTGAAKHCSGYQATVATAVKNARAAGLIVILDLHWSDKGNLANTSPGQQCMADQNSITFWQQVANIYKTDPNVWFELYNEPNNIDWNTWLNGGQLCGYQAVGMQALYNAVRGTGATNIVIAGGREYASDLSATPKLTGNNIAYAIHIYRQSFTWSAASWDGQFGNFAAQVPVISTEFGDQVCNGAAFDQGLLNYFRAHKVGYTGWAWWVQSCAWPSLITDAVGDCNNAAAACVIQKDMESYQ